jgi:hypothetical protein
MNGIFILDKALALGIHQLKKWISSSVLPEKCGCDQGRGKLMGWIMRQTTRQTTRHLTMTLVPTPVPMVSFGATTGMVHR